MGSGIFHIYGPQPCSFGASENSVRTVKMDDSWSSFYGLPRLLGVCAFADYGLWHICKSWGFGCHIWYKASSINFHQKWIFVTHGLRRKGSSSVTAFIRNVFVGNDLRRNGLCRHGLRHGPSSQWSSSNMSLPRHGLRQKWPSSWTFVGMVFVRHGLLSEMVFVGHGLRPKWASSTMAKQPRLHMENNYTLNL